MRASRTYGSVRGARHETRVPTATQAPRVHHAARRRGGGVAARGAGAAAERMRRIGVLMDLAADDAEGQRRIAAFLQGLQRAGLDRRPQRADRLPLGASDRSRPHAQTRGGIGSRSRQTSSWPRRRRSWRRCSRRPAPFRSCSRLSPTRSAPASSPAWRGRAATPLGSSRSNTA